MTPDTFKDLTFALSVTRLVGTGAAAIGSLATYLLFVSQATSYGSGNFFEEGLIFYGLMGMTLVSLLGVPADLFNLWATASDANLADSNIRMASTIFYYLSITALVATLSLLVLSSVGFVLGGLNFVLLYPIMGLVLMLPPVGLSFLENHIFYAHYLSEF